MRATNAAVVGLLRAALYDPVWTSAILGPRAFALALLMTHEQFANTSRRHTPNTKPY